MNKDNIPENFEDFLYWVKETTERRWANFSESKKDGNWWSQRHDVFEGAKWFDPLSDIEIDSLEIKWGVKFPNDFRSFLRILHKVDKEDAHEDEDIETGEISTNRYPLFHDWRNDTLIKDRFEYPFEYIKFDVFESKQPKWLKSWGIKPSSESECHLIVNSWIEKARILIPINKHRYLISEPTQQCNHVISTYGFDTILYSINLREHIINELRWDLGLDIREYDEFEEESKPPPSIISSAIKSLQDNDNVNDKDEEERYLTEREEEYTKKLLERRNLYIPIPYWEEVILYYSSGWGTIGLKFSNENFNLVEPIVVADNITIQKKTE